MALSLVQRGSGAARPLVAAFGPMTVARLPKTLGPTPCIVSDTDPKGAGTETIADIVDFAARQCGVEHFSTTALIGFSIGCKRVKHIRIGGATAGAYLLVDGTHAPWPPQSAHIQWLKDLAAEARQGRILLVASHTYQTYVEKMAQPYASTVTVLRLATGFPLTAGGPSDAPVISRDPTSGPNTSGLWVYSYASKEADYEAHKYQGGTAVHQLAARHLAPWLTGAGSTVPTPLSSKALLVGDSLADGLAGPLRARFRAAGGDLAARSVNGSTIDQWAHGPALSEALTQARPAVTLVSLGTNDLAANPAGYKRPLIEAIVMQIRAAGSAAAWLLPPRMPLPDRGGVRALLAAELARLAVPMHEAEPPDLPRGPDGIHPTPAGFDQWAARIAQWMSTPPAVQPTPGNLPAPTVNTTPAQTNASGSGNGLGILAIAGVLAALANATE